ncbi:hypothetical protein [Parasphingorhabdus sp.]|uniref:hypothetical protein n=1 Tax=Parasphingorhabdus sp. TaxID=2709688 RepID=UPI003BB0D78A
MSGVAPPDPPQVRVSVGVTGHRQAHHGYAAHQAKIEAVMAEIMDVITEASKNTSLLFGPEALAPTRLHTLLVDGTDQVAAHLAIKRDWGVINPLPFGKNLNLAINALPENANDARALLADGLAKDPATNQRAAEIKAISEQAHIFELADQDEKISALFLAKLDAPNDFAKAQAFELESARRAALAGQILIEQSDLVIAVWDGESTANIGGTGYTVAKALDLGSPVIWVDPQSPEDWQILYSSESLAAHSQRSNAQDRKTTLVQIVTNILAPGDTPKGGLLAFLDEKWHDKSARLTHAFRRVEAMFDGGGRPFRKLVQRYEKPNEIASGSGTELLNVTKSLPFSDPELPAKIDSIAMQNFAWADGISSRLSDHYRGGMIVNFILSAFAIVGGVLYLPLVSPDQKWIFALFEFLLLLGIVIITFRGQKYRWHGRWFETRRVAEYFRHSPLLLILGAARAPGQWLQGTETSWPEWYVRQSLRSIGLPKARITAPYLRSTLAALLECHVVQQRDYHSDKSKRLKVVHHNLDRLSEFLFGLAVLSVAIYLLLKGASAMDLVDSAIVLKLSKTFTVLGVLFPTFGAAVAGIRYFGDFERFAAISEVTAEKLNAIHNRASLLLEAPDSALDYGRVTALVHAADEVVTSEIENWQAVFGGKNITVPV